MGYGEFFGIGMGIRELRNLFESIISENYVRLNRDRHPVRHTVGLAQLSGHYRSVSV